MSTKYFDSVRPTYLENWPDDLHRLSIVSMPIKLDAHEAMCLGATIIDWGEAFCTKFNLNYFDAKAVVAKIAMKVCFVLHGFPGQCGFLRLGSRSPKDSWEGQRHGFRIKADDENPLRIIQDCSERIYEDLMLALQEEYAPTLWVREWLEIEKWQEWRCFMRGRKLVGISQGNYLDGKIAECVEHCESVKWAIGQFFPRFCDASHLDDVVFDVIVKRKSYTPTDGRHSRCARCWKGRILSPAQR